MILFFYSDSNGAGLITLTFTDVELLLLFCLKDIVYFNETSVEEELFFIRKHSIVQLKERKK